MVGGFGGVGGDGDARCQKRFARSEVVLWRLGLFGLRDAIADWNY